MFKFKSIIYSIFFILLLIACSKKSLEPQVLAPIQYRSTLIPAANQSVFVVHQKSEIPKQIQSEKIFRTIQEAIDASLSSCTINILQGEYYESINIYKKQGLVIQPYADHKVILNGSRKVPLPKECNDCKRAGATNIKEIPVRISAKDYRFCYNENDVPLWNYHSKEALYQHDIYPKHLAGVYIDKNRLLIESQLLDFKPNKLWLAQTEAIINIKNSENIHIHGKSKQLIIKNGASKNISIINDAVLDSNSEIVISNCKILNGRVGIRISTNKNKIILEGNEIHAKLDSNLVYREIKLGYKLCGDVDKLKPLSYFQTIGVSVSGSPSNVEIINNEIHGHANGIVVLSANGTPALNRCLIRANTLYDISDDGIEIEFKAPNTIVTENFIYGVFNSISLAQIDLGPVYIFNNIISQSKDKWKYKYEKETCKLGYRSSYTLKFYSFKSKFSRDVHIYNNTFYARSMPLRLGGASIDMSPIQSNIVNNVFITEQKNHSNPVLNLSKNRLENNLFINLQRGNSARVSLIPSSSKNLNFPNNKCASLIHPNFDPTDRSSFSLFQDQLSNYKSKSYSSDEGRYLFSATHLGAALNK